VVGLVVVEVEMRMIAAGLGVSVAILVGLMTVVTRAREPVADVTLARSGCDGSAYSVAASHAPELLVSNKSATPMVFSLPDMSTYVTVPPGDRATLALQPQLHGTYRFFCLTEEDHDVLMGDVNRRAFVCGLDAYDFAREAVKQQMVYSEGTIVVEPRSIA
jgi:hypothetical protein